MGAGDPEVTARGAMRIVGRRSGNGSPRGAGLEVRSSTDGSVLASLRDQGPEEVRAAVARLRRNQPAWEALGPSGRGEWVGRLRDWLFDNDGRVAELLQRETGKPWQEATLEVPLAIDGLEYYRKTPGGFWPTRIRDRTIC
jgi:acyl-CoA reductase-like NAD-dependent aldehyde dehydrogenase